MGIDGTYNIVADTPMGKIESTLILKTDGSSLSGSVHSVKTGTVEFDGGMADGNRFEFDVVMKSLLLKLKIHNTGTVDGDNISGELRTSMGNSTYSGVRV